MSETPHPDSTTPAASKSPETRHPVLGLPIDDIGNLGIQDLINNAAAIKMLLHRYREYLDERKRLEERVEALQSELAIYIAYRDGYDKKIGNSRVAAPLNLVGTILIGFGVNFLSTTVTTAGGITLVAGLVVTVVAQVLLLRR